MSALADSPGSPRGHWAQMGEGTLVLGIWLLYWVHRLLGRWPYRVCVYPVVVAYWLSRPVLRRASREYLERLEAATGALGYAPTARDSLHHVAVFAETVLDKVLAVSGRYRYERVQTSPGREQLYAVAARGQGGLIVTAHVGCLELCRGLAEHRGSLKLNILVHTRHAEQFNRMLKRMNPEHDVNLMEVTDVNPATAVLLNEKVARGEYVAIAGDRVPVVASQTVVADFLGHPAPFPVGPWVLAFLLKCPVWLLACVHDGPGYRVHAELLAEQVLLPRANRQAALAGYAAHYAEALGRLLRRSPFDWFNFFHFWDQAHGATVPES